MTNREMSMLDAVVTSARVYSEWLAEQRDQLIAARSRHDYDAMANCQCTIAATLHLMQRDAAAFTNAQCEKGE